MSKFRIKEVKEARINSNGQKSSIYYPQVTNCLGIFRNIRPSEMKSEKYEGKVIAFKSDSPAMNFIREYREVIGWVRPAHKPTKAKKQSKVVYHTVNW